MKRWKFEISLLCRRPLRRPEDGPGGARVGDGPPQRHPLLRRQGRQPGGAGQRAVVLRRGTPEAGETLCYELGCEPFPHHAEICSGNGPFKRVGQ